jgi:aspartate aminotransferase-like enzyme
VLRDVKLRGPEKALRRIEEDPTQVWAYYRLTADDLEAGVESAALQMHLPPEVTVASALPRVHFRIRESSSEDGP